jgi:hypothetical protein
MGKFDRFEQFQQSKSMPTRRVHPIWRGIGCVMLLLIPIVSYAAADTFFDNSSDLMIFGSTVFPRQGNLYHVYYSIPLWGDSVLRISLFHLIFTLFFSVIGFMIFSLIYAIVYRFTGPPTYGPTDAPPVRRSRRKRRR